MSKREPFRNVELAQEYPQQEVFEHHVLMAFLHDEDAAFFREWWEAQGSINFNRWLNARPTEEQ